MGRRIWGVVAAALFFSLISCIDIDDEQGITAEQLEEKRIADSLETAERDSVKLAELNKKHDIFPEISYQKIYIENLRQLLDIKEKYRNTNKAGHIYKALQTINRKEIRYFRIGDTIIVPDTIIDDTRAYSIFPQYYHGAREIPKIILVSNKYQCYGCYEYGVLVRFAAANTGKERTPTFPGRYALVWKDPLRRSSLDSNWVMPFTWNFHAAAGSAFHKFDMPGRPVSHSCVRQFLEDSEWLFHWGNGIKYDENRRAIPFSGTPVLIIDIFDFSRKRYGPWMEIATNKPYPIELPEKPMEYEEALIPWCQIPEDSRTAELRKRYFYAEDTLRARGIIRDKVQLIPTQNFNKLRREKAEKERKRLEAEQRKIQEQETELKDIQPAADTLDYRNL